MKSIEECLELLDKGEALTVDEHLRLLSLKEIDLEVFDKIHKPSKTAMAKLPLIIQTIIVSEKYGAGKLAGNLVESLKCLGISPVRLRLYTDKKGFDNNAKSLEKFNDFEKKTLNSGVDVVCATPDGGMQYSYIYKPVTDASKKYKSVFIGVEYSKNQFTKSTPMFNIIEDAGNYVVYVNTNSPSCLRVCYRCDWDKASLDYMLKVECSYLFD